MRDQGKWELNKAFFLLFYCQILCFLTIKSISMYSLVARLSLRD